MDACATKLAEAGMALKRYLRMTADGAPENDKSIAQDEKRLGQSAGKRQCSLHHSATGSKHTVALEPGLVKFCAKYSHSLSTSGNTSRLKRTLRDGVPRRTLLLDAPPPASAGGRPP